MNNIEVFNQSTGVVFKKLYASFPSPVYFATDTLQAESGIPDEQWGADEDGVNPIGRAIVWLRHEGYVRYHANSHDTRFTELVLTEKGLAALNRVPESLSGKVTIGERLRELSMVASGETVSALVRIALGGGA